MITITITPFPAGRSYTWTEKITSAPYVWKTAGVDLKEFEGRKPIDCSKIVRRLISTILNDPREFIACASYPDLRDITANLTRLCFTLQEIPEGTVHVE